ncbi:hypothetical protein V6Z11_D07G081400 [Gossypium hirsutum]
MSLPAMLVGETVGEMLQANQFARQILAVVDNKTKNTSADPKTPLTEHRKQRCQFLKLAGKHEETDDELMDELEVQPRDDVDDEEFESNFTNLYSTGDEEDMLRWDKLLPGPRSRATHWKQTVLYLEDVLTICEGETIIGSMTVAPNKKNPRDVDIMVKYSLSGRRCVVSRVQFYKMR